jgi:FkbM family methyltransferase
MAHFRDILPFSTWPLYLLWHYTQRKPFRCRLRGGPEISIRPDPSHDYQTACEIFFDRIYDCDLDPDSVRRIVDLGGNVGYSCLFWCEKYPNASVLTFEPHPTHCQLLEWHMNKNGYANRVKLVAAAAGVLAGVANFSDEDDGSAIVQDMPAGSMKVQVVDVFQAVPDAPIDILKIDIEGSEYAILADPRFEALAARTERVLLEWHARGEQGEALCRDRLASLGFTVGSGRSCGSHWGMLYGTRDG